MCNPVRSLVWAAFFGVAVSCWAQPSARILGKVKDASGAVVEGAQITAVNTATGLSRSTLSTNTGDFELAALPITGAYTLTVVKQGFETQQYTGVVLQVD
jgi:hypothetical protein